MTKKALSAQRQLAALGLALVSDQDGVRYESQKSDYWLDQTGTANVFSAFRRASPSNIGGVKFWLETESGLTPVKLVNGNYESV